MIHIGDESNPFYLCSDCPRLCSAVRYDTEGRGFCRTGTLFKIARCALHFWEEPCISGKNGSGTVFLSGCNLKCVFCQNYCVSHLNQGAVVSDEKLRALLQDLIKQGAHNINFVNPSHYSAALHRFLSKNKLSVPVVYNTSSYDSVDSLKKLEGLTDVYLPDLKLADATRTSRYLNCTGYFPAATKAIVEMLRQQPKPVYNEDNMLLKGVLIRHLVLPGNLDQTYKIIDWMSEHVPENNPISIMAQYVPCGKVTKQEYPEINRGLTKREYHKAVDYILQKNFTNVYIQEFSSASKTYIPDFNIKNSTDLGD